MHRAHVNVDRVEQQRGAVRIGVEPTLESNLLEVFWFSGARLDLRIVHVLDVGLLPVMSYGADSGNVEPERGFQV